ncbi:hypothetical protein Tco_0389029 [Tanacetum coccineum]
MFQNCITLGCWFGGEADSETSTKRSLRRKLFKTCCMDWGEVNPTHAYYNGSCTSKDNEDPSWSTSFKTRRTQKTSSALEVLWKTLFLLYLYMIGTLLSYKSTSTLKELLKSSKRHGVFFHLHLREVRTSLSLDSS